MNVKDWVVIITGGGTGVGAAAARKLAAGGARLVLNYSRSAEAAEECARECRELGGEAITVQGNVADDTDCHAIVQAALDKWGRVDGLLNNAGTTIFRGKGDFEGLTAEDFQHIYSVNVIGAFQMARAVAKPMREAGAGSIVNTSSVAGTMAMGSSIAYGASKGAMNTMTLWLARDLAPQIRVNAVAPGFISGRWWREKMDDEAYDKMIANVEANTPLNRAASPEDIAESIVWLLAGAVNVTGEILITDAGSHLGGTPLVAR